MRILQLQLLAFGHFSGTALDFMHPPPAFHLIHGNNEAGKSTILRAVRGLLYGIPQQSSDTFRFAGKDLRIGASLENERGQQITFLRRKGRKNTLLTPEDEPLEPDALAPYLGAVDENLFCHMFGLNHETLRQGAQELLEGQGNLSESLFGAGSGTARARLLLSSLRERADQLFTSKGRGRKRINQEITELRETRPLVARASTSAASYLEKERALKQAQADLEGLKQERALLESERRRLERLLRILPQVARHKALLGQRQALGQLPDLPEQVSDWREEAQKTLQDATRERALLEGELHRQQQRLEGLQVPQSLAELDASVSEQLRDQLGQHKKAQRDLPKRQGELRAARDKIRGLLREMGQEPDDHGDPLARAAELLGSRVVERKLRRLIDEKLRQDAALAAQSAQQLKTDSARSRWKKELERLDAGRDTAQLRHALSRAQKHLQLEERTLSTRGRLERLQRRLDQQFAALGHYQGALGDLSRMAWPGEVTLARFDTEFRGYSEAVARAEERSGELEDERLKLRQSLAELDASNELPTQQGLSELRQQRDELLKQLPSTNPGELVPWVRAVRSIVDACDRYADTLRAESRRVEKKTQLGRALHTIEQQLERLGRVREESFERQARLESQWLALWEPLRTQPSSPAEMRVWLERVREIRKLLEQRDEEQAEFRDNEGRLAEVVKELSSVLEELGEPKRMLWESLTQLVERAESVALLNAQQTAERDEVRRRLNDAEANSQESARALAELKEQQKLWKGAWQRGIKSLGLPREAGIDEVASMLDGLTDLSHQVDEARQLERRILGMQRDAQQFAEQITVLVEQVLPDCLSLPLEEAADTLIKAHGKALQDAQLRRVTADELEQHAAKLRRVVQVEQRARERLSELLNLAGVQTVEQLAHVEERVRQCRELERRLDEMADAIVNQGEGQSFVELVSAAAELDADHAESRLVEIRAELSPLEGRYEQLVQERTTRENELSSLGEGAARAAEEFAAARARLRESVSEYLRYRLAAILLEAEVERYREQHQGPVLGLARELFPALTLGEFSGLRVGYDKNDEQILLCVRSDSNEVGVEHLSDGTRDQLYLALRLASLQHYMQHHESMPLVLDDVLIHFDDERARAALTVLGKFADQAQILFFTHHSRLRELAEEAVPKQTLCLHELRR